MAIELSQPDFQRLTRILAGMDNWRDVQSRLDFTDDVFAGSPRRGDILNNLNLGVFAYSPEKPHGHDSQRSNPIAIRILQGIVVGENCMSHKLIDIVRKQQKSVMRHEKRNGF